MRRAASRECEAVTAGELGQRRASRSRPCAPSRRTWPAGRFVRRFRGSGRTAGERRGMRTACRRRFPHTSPRRRRQSSAPVRSLEVVDEVRHVVHAVRPTHRCGAATVLADQLHHDRTPLRECGGVVEGSCGSVHANVSHLDVVEHEERPHTARNPLSRSDVDVACPVVASSAAMSCRACPPIVLNPPPA